MHGEEVTVHVVADEEAKLPEYNSFDAAGADVTARLKGDLVLLPGESALIPTGLRMAIPRGYEIQVRPRSGLAFKHGITVLNTPGTIDADYRGEVGIILINHGQEPFTICPGMRIAQLILAPVVRASFSKAEVLEETHRGEGGFGHTGYH